jgi:hypothetical protein
MPVPPNSVTGCMFVAYDDTQLYVDSCGPRYSDPMLASLSKSAAKYGMGYTIWADNRELVAVVLEDGAVIRYDCNSVLKRSVSTPPGGLKHSQRR